MLETLGTLNLKIARLEHRLAILKQQERMSNAYPTRKAELVREYLQLQTELGRLTEDRQRLVH
ncbi:MAG: hypothetical protein HC875_35840 [Anaerolineales bacterium]|nr:hypothetical protein [Anaerolineales bacterium]